MPSQIPSKIRNLLPDWRIVLSGVLIVLSFPTWDITPLIWICLVPWLLTLDRTDSPREAFKQGLWLSVFMTLGGFYWVSHVLVEFGELPWIVGVIGLLLLSLINQPQFLIFGPLRVWLRRQFETEKPLGHLGFALTAALLYSGIDWLLPKLFVDTMGHAFYRSPHMRQAADLGGPWMLTFVVYFVAEGLVAIRKTKLAAGLSIAFALAAFGYGLWRLPQIQALEHDPKTPTMQFGVIQANIGDFDKIAAERGVRGAAEKVVETFFQLSDQALAMTPRPQALVWPETSYPSTFRTPGTPSETARDAQIEDFARTRGVPLLFGGYDSLAGKDFNAFFFLDPKEPRGQDLQIYRKHILLLFGEYIPLADSIDWIKKTFPQVGNFGRGVGPSVLTVNGVKVNPIICYEALFPSYILEAVRKGSRMTLNITNDSWFGPWGEPQLHLALTTFRAIEARVPQLRSTNTGISTLILPDGEITQPTKVFEPEILNAKVPLIPPVPTLMLAWGDWWGWFALATGSLGTGLAVSMRRRRQHLSKV